MILCKTNFVDRQHVFVENFLLFIMNYALHNFLLGSSSVVVPSLCTKSNKDTTTDHIAAYKLKSWVTTSGFFIFLSLAFISTNSIHDVHGIKRRRILCTAKGGRRRGCYEGVLFEQERGSRNGIAHVLTLFFPTIGNHFVLCRSICVNHF